MALFHEQLQTIINSEEKIQLNYDSVLVLVVDVQRAFTDPNHWLATTFFGTGEVSASLETINNIWQFALNMKNSGATVAAIKLVHDVKMMAKLDPQRLKAHRETEPPLVEMLDGIETHKILKPNSEDVELNFGTTNLSERQFHVLEKCMRDLSRQPEIRQFILENHAKTIIIVGMDANVCILESTVGLLTDDGLDFERIIVPVDVISTRPSEVDDAIEKLGELSDKRLIFINSTQLN